MIATVLVLLVVFGLDQYYVQSFFSYPNAKNYKQNYANVNLEMALDMKIIQVPVKVKQDEYYQIVTNHVPKSELLRWYAF